MQIGAPNPHALAMLLPPELRPRFTPKRNVTNDRNRAIEKQIYSDPVTAHILKNLGKHGEARTGSAIGCGSVECCPEWINLHADSIPRQNGKRVVPFLTSYR